LAEQKIENKHLKLRMKMRLWFLYEEKGEIRLSCLREFDNDGCHIKEIRITEARKSDILWRNTRVRQSKPQIASNVRENLRGESEGGGLWAHAASQIPKGSIDLCIDRIDYPVRSLSTPHVVEKTSLFPFGQKVLQERRNTGGSPGADCLASVSERGQENMPDQVGGTRLRLRSVEFPRPESGLTTRVGWRLALVAHSEDGDVSRRVRHGANQKALDRVAQAGEATLNSETLLGASAAEVVVVRISLPSSVQGKREEAEAVDNIGLSAVVLADKDGEIRP
jgi:hypothetical protein